VKIPDFDPYISAPEGDLTSGRGLVLLEFSRKWRQEAAGMRIRVPRTHPLARLVAWLRGPFAAQGGAS
jgi:hypothetical protein